MDSAMIPPRFFVYGTLKTGQVRENNWPVKPLRVEQAWTLGRLYDTGPYPALLQGQDRVAGQLWTFAPDTIAMVVERLDQIEGTNQVGQRNDYDRAIGTVWRKEQSEPVSANYYLFARLDFVQHFTYLTPELRNAEDRYSIWPSDAAWEV
ncbi:MAG: gamma-glutamylcyclotransferase family protein [Planctomycetota bacterium]